MPLAVLLLRSISPLFLSNLGKARGWYFEEKSFFIMGFVLVCAEKIADSFNMPLRAVIRLQLAGPDSLAKILS